MTASMAGLFVIDDATFNSLAVGAILVVAVAVLGSITVLPALLVKLGRWVDVPRVPLLVSGGALLVLALPALGMKIHSGNLETLPDSIPEVQTFQKLAEEFPVEGATALLVVRAPAGDRADVSEALAGVNRAALDTSGFVASGRDPVRVSEDGTTSVLQLAVPFNESDPEVDRAIESLRSDLAPAGLDGLDAEYAVGGGAAESLDFADRQNDSLPIVIGVVLLLTLMMMAFAFRSLPIALVSTALNLLSSGWRSGSSPWSSSTDGERGRWTSPVPVS